MKKLFAIALAVLLSGAVACTPQPPEPPEPTETYYSVTFNADGGTPAPTTQSVKEGETATVPPTVTRTGYVFLFWSQNGTSAYNFATPVKSDITLTAKWQAEATVEYWQVTWHLDGGAWPGEGDDHATQVVKGGTLAEPAPPTKTGHTFEGWYKEEALTNRITFPYDVSTLTADFTLYAAWEEIPVLASIAVTTPPTKMQYTVGDEFDPAGMVVTATYSDGRTETVASLTAENFTYDFSTHGTDKTVTVTYEGKTATVTGITVIPADPKAAYFGSWRVWLMEEVGKWLQFTISADRIEWLFVEGDMCVIEGLTWTEIVNTEGGSEYTDGYRISGTMTKNGFFLARPDSPSYQLGDIVEMNFYLSGDMSSVLVTDFRTPLPDEAHDPYHSASWWLEKYGRDIDAFWNVSYELNGGSWPADADPAYTVIKDGAVPPPGNPTKYRHSFGGWYTDAALTDRAYFPYHMNYVTADLKLYAKWDVATEDPNLRKAAYCLAYVVEVTEKKKQGQNISSISGVCNVNYNANLTLNYISFSQYTALVPYLSNHPLTMGATSSSNVSAVRSARGQILNATYDYENDPASIFGYMGTYSGQLFFSINELGGKSTLQKMQEAANNYAITAEILGRMHYPYNSYKMLVFGRNSEGVLIGKYLGYATVDGKKFDYLILDPDDPKFGQLSSMSIPN